MNSMEQTAANLAGIAREEANLLEPSRIRSLWMSSVFAGFCVGMGILLIFTFANQIPDPFKSFMMAASFPIALVLVIFTNSALFTGLVMNTWIAKMYNKISAIELIQLWVISWTGNFIGAIMLCLVYRAGFDLDSGVWAGGDAIAHVAQAKMNLSTVEMIARGALCNMFVCFAIMMQARTDNDAAKIWLISLCLFGFIGSGYEHSVANMTILVAGLMDLPEVGHSSDIWLSLKNLLFVSVGNVLGGVFVAQVVLNKSKHAKVEQHKRIESKLTDVTQRTG